MLHLNLRGRESWDFFRANHVVVSRYDWDAPIERTRPSCRGLTNATVSLSKGNLSFWNLQREFPLPLLFVIAFEFFLSGCG